MSQTAGHSVDLDFADAAGVPSPQFFCPLAALTPPMSDTDDSGFDKEAERERLREKYGDQDREETQRMSELLLQGATMTNRHCGECGNPIFRYEGRAFCSVCEEERPAEEAGQQSPQPDETDSAPASASTETISDSPSIADEGSEQSDSVPTRESPADQPVSEPPEREPPSPEADPPGRTEPESTQTETDRTPSREAVDEDAANDLSAAQASLRRTLRDSAARAEQTADGRSRQDHLAAAREAAEALAALDRVRQS